MAARSGGVREFVWHAQLFSVKQLAEKRRNCFWGTFFPSVLFARNVTRITDGTTSFVRAALTHLALGGCWCWCCCVSYYAAYYREQLRKRRNLPVEPCSDLHTHMFCHPCAICQEELELDALLPPSVPVPPEPTIDRTPSQAKEHIEAVRKETMER